VNVSENLREQGRHYGEKSVEYADVPAVSDVYARMSKNTFDLADRVELTQRIERIEKHLGLDGGEAA
jgi:hypothetical protein